MRERCDNQSGNPLLSLTTFNYVKLHLLCSALLYVYLQWKLEIEASELEDKLLLARLETHVLQAKTEILL